jgi:hypothetical protein
MRLACVAAMVILASAPAFGQNESDWKPYFTYKDVTFFFAPSTLKRDGAVREVKWHDTRNPQVVFKIRIDCAARTIQALSADQYDLLTGAFYATADLSTTPVDALGGPDSMGSHLAGAVC